MNTRSGAESRAKIVQGAMEVFSRQGYARANIRAIAQKAGTSVGTIYLHFRNKEDLYKSLLGEIRRDMVTLTAAASVQAKSASAALSQFIRLYIQSAVRHREFFILHLREHGFTFDVDEKKRFQHNQTRLIEKIILRGIACGEFRKCNARETARLFFGSLRGVILSLALNRDGAIAPGTVEDFLLRGLLRTPGKC